MKFTRPVLDEEVNAIAGHYIFVKEGILPVNGRHVLYFVGLGSADASCCGTAGCIYAYVPGYVEGGRMYGEDEKSGNASDAAAVGSEERQGIAEILKRSENVTQVIFLTEKGSSEAVF